MAKKPVAASFTEVTPLGRRRLDPYTGVFVAPGDKYVLDSNKANMLAEMGEVEIIKEDIVPPWAKKPEPTPVKEK
jgi:hypothetical protein